MTDLRFFTTDVFTNRAFGGNALAVFPECPPIGDALMQSLARELNLSESVFVFPPADKKHTRKVRIFTPGKEVPFAGHPTIGTAIVLASRGYLGPIGKRADIVLEEGAGPVPVVIEHRTTGYFAALTAPRVPEVLSGAPGREIAAPMLGLSDDDLASEASPVFSSAGLGFYCVAVKPAALARASLDVALWRRALSQAPVQEVFVFTLDDWRTGKAVRARMFGPAAGLIEDPATGSAAAALGRILVDLQRPADGETSWVISQGVEMGRPSTLHLKARMAGGKLTAVEVGGEAVPVSEGWFYGL